MPRIRAAIPAAVNCVGSEDAQELAQDGAAMAAKMIHHAEQAGKKVTRAATGRRGEISAGNVAYFTMVKLRNGCRSTGYVTGDVYGAGTQINGRTRLNSLDEAVATDDETGGEIFLLHDVLSDQQEDPGTRAARKMDWQEFVAALPERERVAVEFMAEGKTLRDAAHVLRVSDSAMQSAKRNLAVKVLAFMGFDILVQIQRRPQWKDSLYATRERLACRQERRC
ncbi:MAG: hypothetical protein ABSA47_10030 [Verrucomicrobiota bacterium]|jgi:hypothetical protein